MNKNQTIYFWSKRQTIAILLQDKLLNESDLYFIFIFILVIEVTIEAAEVEVPLAESPAADEAGTAVGAAVAGGWLVGIDTGAAVEGGRVVGIDAGAECSVEAVVPEVVVVGAERGVEAIVFAIVGAAGVVGIGVVVIPMVGAALPIKMVMLLPELPVRNGRS